MQVEKPLPERRAHFWSSLGPGVVTGAADDDPSGIVTYSIAGALHGTKLIWLSFITWPLMTAVQMMCARIGMVTGTGLISVFRKRIPAPLLVAASLALLAANSINIAADLAGMAQAAEMLTHVDSHVFVVVFGAGIAWATVRLRYHQIARILKWLALLLFVYVAAAIDVVDDWHGVFLDAVNPTIPTNSRMWSTVVAILGTTISPYLFFWQASQEVEEERHAGRLRLSARLGATADEIRARRFDVGLGTLFSNVIMFFVIVTTAFTLHRAGKTEITSTEDIVEALRPLMSQYAGVLFTLGLVGVGLLAIPTLSGSAAYALAETFHYREGLDRKLRSARFFYGVVIFSTAAGVALDFTDIPAIDALYWSAIINGLLSPFLLVGILIVASDRRIMHGQPSPWIGRLAVGLAALVMFAAAFAMFVF